MEFSLTILGSNSAIPASVKYPTAQLLKAAGRFFLIDCAEGTQIQLRRNKIGFSKINHIFISHLHGDHFFGLFGLISTFNLLGRRSDLHIWSPAGLGSMISGLFTAMGEVTAYKPVFHEVDTASVNLLYEDKYLTVHSLPLKHRIPACGFLFREKEQPAKLRKELITEYNLSIVDIRRIKAGSDHLLPDGTLIANSALTIAPAPGRSYAFCSDTAYTERFIDQIRGVDLLYHEATFLERDQDLARKTFHSTTKQAANIARLAGTKQLLIGHFSTRYPNDDEFVKEAITVFPDTLPAEENKTYFVGQD